MIQEQLWKPEIDKSECNNCRICVEFCFRKVFGIDADGEVQVVAGDNCVNNCHGCEWRCPQVAITFPKPITQESANKTVAYYKKKGKKVPVEFIDFVKKRYGLEINAK
ncbi:MAG: ferredoxin family protein [Candidatus Omnitrophica bacterium]|nr:ferredoxin family protein [Candidatus Omnitrophota bacterium]